MSFNIYCGSSHTLEGEQHGVNILGAHLQIRAGTDGYVRVGGPWDPPEMIQVMRRVCSRRGGHPRGGEMTSCSASGDSGVLGRQPELRSFMLNSNTNSKLFSPF